MTFRGRGNNETGLLHARLWEGSPTPMRRCATVTHCSGERNRRRRRLPQRTFDDRHIAILPDRDAHATSPDDAATGRTLGAVNQRTRPRQTRAIDTTSPNARESPQLSRNWSDENILIQFTSIRFHFSQSAITLAKTPTNFVSTAQLPGDFARGKSRKLPATEPLFRPAGRWIVPSRPLDDSTPAGRYLFMLLEAGASPAQSNPAFTPLAELRPHRRDDVSGQLQRDST